jgi:hypothetical protein
LQAPIFTRICDYCSEVNHWHVDCIDELLVNEDCGPPDCFSPAWLEFRDKLEAASPKQPSAVVAMSVEDGSHIPASDRIWSENRMADDSKSGAHE